MKRKLSVILSLALVLSIALAGCGNNPPPAPPDSSGSSNPPAEAFKFTENMTIIVPYKAGGGVDVAVRALLEAGLRDQLGTSVSVENVGGGNTLIGAQQVLGAPADGYTVFVNTCAAFLAAPQMYDNPYTLEDWQYITTLGVTELLVAGGPSAPANTVDDLITFGKENPDGVTVGCAGYGDISAHYP
jgi:tripartite-type tricarboxylate transporter receptor subunit TctC